MALSLPNSLSLSWSPPKRAKEIVTQYSLDMDEKLVYTSKGQNYTITGTTLSLSGNRCVCVFSRWPLWIRWVIFASLEHQGNLGTLLAQTFLDSTDHMFEAECQCAPPPPVYMDSVSWLNWWHPSRSHGHRSNYLRSACVRNDWRCREMTQCATNLKLFEKRQIGPDYMTSTQIMELPEVS